MDDRSFVLPDGLDQAASDVPSTRFRPGQSGNPAGRPKKTEEEKEALAKIKSLAPDVADYMVMMLKNPRCPAVAKVRILEIILERTYGKPESSVKVTNTAQSIEAAEARIQTLVSHIQLGGTDD